MTKIKKFIGAPITIINVAFSKIRPNGFALGIIFGAVFGLIVNVATIQLQETINQQLYLEALESEIVSHYVESRTQMDSIASIIDNNELPNPFRDVSTYSNKIWNSPEVLRYLVKLDTKTQAEIMSYYRWMESKNYMLNQLSSMSYSVMSDCMDPFSSQYLSEIERQDCIEIKKAFLTGEYGSHEEVEIMAGELLANFFPRQKRLNDPALRMLMGKSAKKLY